MTEEKLFIWDLLIIPIIQLIVFALKVFNVLHAKWVYIFLPTIIPVGVSAIVFVSALFVYILKKVRLI